MDDKHAPAVAFMFSGQGNPVIGMGADLWHINQQARQIWDCASDISQMDIRRLCLKGPMNKLVQTPCQQVAVTAINVTLYTLLLEKLNVETAVGCCGHSVGEYSALYAAKAVSLEDLFKIIHFRSQLMHELSKENNGTMYVVKGIDYHTMTELIARSDIELDVSCDNSPHQQVIGGTSAALTAFVPLLARHGFDAFKPGVSGAWHTRLMAQGVKQMCNFLATVEIKRPDFDVLMNVTGCAEYEPEKIKHNLALHLTHTVKWTDSMARLLSHPLTPVLIEVSNKAYLGHMLKDFPGFTSEMTQHCRTITGAL
ncbi:Malonyl CoA-acyl carrier protein transacylase [Pantoea sp. AS-PWVM4]|uniref:ACP S-malonyltransferase n=1 Tax=Pantoea sp. AS-PWVM4 TaxID=1332069 RepID=UPI0003AC6ACB|nr:ACP S-malonyltransferase [Pantoea sp. AS-PWVM4]ERK10260.1 Malonyl CoA-acyl carrier protein transacylase [Pantoea sp. AS-PWVM4]